MTKVIDFNVTSVFLGR